MISYFFSRHHPKPDRVTLVHICSVCSENGVPVFSLNDQKKDLALQVTVKNKNGDDAHEAKLVGTFPDTLSYSGFRSHKTTVKINT